MSERESDLVARVREAPLANRLKESHARIGKMCSEGRPPRMSIPVAWDDDDFYIVTTLKDAQAELESLTQEIGELREDRDRGWNHAKAMGKVADREKEHAESLQTENAELRGSKSDWKALAQNNKRVAEDFMQKVSALQAKLAQYEAEVLPGEVETMIHDIYMCSGIGEAKHHWIDLIRSLARNQEKPNDQ